MMRADRMEPEPTADHPAGDGTGAWSRAVAPCFVAGSVAVVALGVMALLRSLSAAVDGWLTWRAAAEQSGPLTIAVAVWLVAWAVLVVAGRPRRVTRVVVVLCLCLVALAALLAFPPFDTLVG